MSWLLEFLKGAADAIVGGIVDLWNSALVWVTAGFAFVAALLSQLYEWVAWAASGMSVAGGAMGNTLGLMGSYEPAGATGILVAGLQFVNCLFPVTETIAMGAILLLITKSGLVYRFIKSWLPVVGT